VDISQNHFIWNGTNEELKNDVFNNMADELEALISIYKLVQPQGGSLLAWKLSYEHDKVDLALTYSAGQNFVICERPAMTMKRVPKRKHGILTFLGKFYKHFRTPYYSIFKS
jgi:hypothetical protein